MAKSRVFSLRPGKIGTAVLYYLAYGALTFAEIANADYLHRHERWELAKIKEKLSDKYNERQVRNAIYNLEKRGLVLRDGDYLSFNDRRIDVLHQINVAEFTPVKHGWDKKWRVVIFDIPENYRKYRDLLRSKLVEAGAVRAQKSVWITPADIEPLINYLRDRIGLGDHVQLIVADRISNQRYFLKKFNLE